MERLLPVSSKLGFGVGQIGEAINTTASNTFVLFFFNQVLGVSATLTGLALGIAVFFDAITDPVAGSISDRLRSRWGRRHPLMAGSALPLALSLAALFNPPAGMSEMFYFAWLLGCSLLVRLFLTLYHVPHLALGAEMAHDYTDRTRIFGYSTLFGTVGGMGFAFVSLTFFFPTLDETQHGLLNRAGYVPFSMAAAVGIVIAISLCVWGTWKEIPHLKQQNDGPVERLGVRRLARELGSVFQNRSYLVVFFGLLFGMLVVSIEGVFNLYMSVHFWGLPTESIRWVAIASVCAVPFAVLLAPLLTRRLEKKGTLILSCVCLLVSSNVLICLRLFSDVLPPNGDPWILYLILTTAFAAGLVGPIIGITLSSMMADIADEQELRTGDRQEGIIYAARSFSIKVAGAAGAVLGGIGLDLISFPRQAELGQVPAEVVFRLGLIAGPVASIFLLTNTLIFTLYRLDRRRVAAIKAELERRGGIVSPRPQEPRATQI
jgi:Na+/melibiose symporter-like transporter